MFSDSQEKRPEPSVSDKKASGQSQVSLTPEQVRAGSTVIMTHAERQAFWKNFLASFEDTSDWPNSTSEQENLQASQAQSQRINSVTVKELLERARKAGIPPSQAFVGADLSGAKLQGMNFLGFNLSGANLSKADLSEAKLRFANLNGTNLSGANLSSTDLREAELCSTNLSSTDLREAELCSTNLSSADLTDVDLGSANLSSADLTFADLSNANLSGVFMENADLSGADLNGADLSNAYLIGVKMSDTNLSNVTVRNAQFGENVDLLDEIKLDLKSKGAIFLDSPGDRSEVMTLR
jgi:uncharacterized protein YjbI with pentapeptide repeats